MRLGQLNPQTIQKAVAIYQDLAYGQSKRRPRGLDEAMGSGDLAAVLGQFQREQCEPIPGYPCVRYSLRLGNRNYPFMKLQLQEHLVAGEFYFCVDTHDQMDIKPDYPDYEAWMAVRRFNRELKTRIEQQFDAEGLDTAAALRRLLAGRCAHDAAGCRATVLVVDDEEDLADAVALLLQDKGFRVFKVHDGAQALRAASELLPDLVLLDYELPELDGVEVIGRLRGDPATANLPVLLTSAAKVSMADIKRADGFLAKPFQDSLLFEMVNRLLAASHRGTP